MGWTVAFALGLLLLAPAMAHAQRRGGGMQYGNYGYMPGYGVQGYGVQYGNYGYMPGYGVNPYYGSSGYTVPQWTGQTNPYAYGQYNTLPSYDLSGVTQAMYQSGNAPAYVRIFVPTPDAQVFFGDQSTQQTNTTVRDFVSPPLEPGKQFQYEIRATWKQGDQTKDEKRTVDVQAGGRAMVNFLPQQQGNMPMPGTQQLNQPSNQPSGTRPRDTEHPSNTRPGGTDNTRPGGTDKPQ
jgi:uncharacterized protein (TIGR03000 family)